MTADAEIVTAVREGVLLLPNQAIAADRAAGTYAVQRVVQTAEGMATNVVPVTIGVRNADFTEITSGLAEGDTVLLGNLSLETSGGQPSFGPNPGQLGGAGIR
jgi:multidrug efflux pump subunit AcrA (membrane-fusion protein)